MLTCQFGPDLLRNSESIACSHKQIAHFVGLHVAGNQLRMRALMTTGANLVQADCVKSSDPRAQNEI